MASEATSTKSWMKRNLSRFSILSLAAFSLAALAAGPSSAAKIEPFEIDAEKMGITITGEITNGDAARFRAIQTGNKRVIVILDSEGGVLSDALEIGELIRAKGLGTGVINGSQCNSACALIWLAGTPRALSKSAEIGFHAAWIEKGGSTYESGSANAMVGRYLTLLDLPKSAILFATTAPPDKLNYLTAYNYQALGIQTKVTKDYGTSSSEPAQAASPKSEETEIWKSVGIWTIGIDHTLDSNCYIRAFFEGDTIFRIGVKDIKEGQFYVSLQNPKWKSLQTGQKYNIGIQFDRLGSWDVPTVASTLEDLPALFGQFNDKQFWVEFIRANVLRVTTNGKSVANLSLEGSSAAFDELGRCQRYQNSRRASRDPFAG